LQKTPSLFDFFKRKIVGKEYGPKAEDDIKRPDDGPQKIERGSRIKMKEKREKRNFSDM
jgi:hypothetical protein